MNYPITVVFGLICLAILAHLTGGILESLTVRPSNNTQQKLDEGSFAKLERNWVQLMCAFQLVSIDLVAIALVLYLLAFTNYLQPTESIAFGMAIFFALWGVVWLVQIACLKRPKKDYLILSHWVFWFVCSGLMFWGAKTL